MDAMEFFQNSAGRWRSQRTTHHLPFRRSETGNLDISVEAYAKDHPKVIEICQLHEIDPALAMGGAYVRWGGSMAWDQEGEDHESSTIFALVPDDETGRKGRLLRERGYAEVVPVVGRYAMDAENGLTLITEYETMSSVERFWFVSPDLRFRSSTVKRFGGFNTAGFCAESRIPETAAMEETHLTEEQTQTVTKSRSLYSALGW
ncbi:MAG: phycobiliprotein lyase [Merismopedia sp. SIO2A8]|nr:phycobiliprotein lyase [Symploca sp. SIO2B6]NET51230.1 phycobiliprotein lyase [Merismopedia sp. SIO2A8]